MVTEYAYPILGGISEHVHFLSRELVALGHDVTVITGRSESRDVVNDIDERAFRDHGYRTHRLGRAIPIPQNGSVARQTWVPPWQMRKALAGADVVHVQGLVGALNARQAINWGRAPVTVGTFHTYTEGGQHWSYRWFGRQLNRTLSKLDRRIAVSQACIDALEATFGGGFDIIPNGVDCDRFRPLQPGETAPDGPARLLFVARLEPRNQLGHLLEAAAILRARGRDVVVQVAGSGPTRQADEALAHKLGIADHVEWLGLIHDDLPQRYREATVLAAPCTLASFGVILIEAAASGIPIVCADNVGFRQVIREGMPGRFVPMNNPAALADGLDEVIRDPGLRADWGRRGRALTVERYAWAGVARQVSDLYHETLAAKRGVPSPVASGASAPAFRS